MDYARFISKHMVPAAPYVILALGIDFFITDFRTEPIHARLCRGLILGCSFIAGGKFALSMTEDASLADDDGKK